MSKRNWRYFIADILECISEKLEKGNIEVAKEGIDALIEIGYLPSDGLIPPPKELQEKVNNIKLSLIIDNR